ncbi:MAG: ATP-grasp domain-containing protein, partial [candidate division WOR-3 bacterium]|nr:ATP-grasp domain-containing protein [candidate division WOR-3 bacterium]
ENPQPGVPFARLLRRANFSGKIIGFVYDAYESGIYCRGLVDEVYMVPFPSSGTEALLARIKQILQKTKIDIIVPTLDAELLPYITINDELRAYGIKMFLPTKEQFLMRDKTQLEEFGKKFKIPVPKTWQVYSVLAVNKIRNNLRFPVVVKGRFYEAYTANNFDELAKYINLISWKWGPPVLLQEYIAGEEYNVCAIGDGQGGIVAILPVKKIVITEKGKGFAGVVIKDQKLTRFLGKIMKALAWRGPLELEIRKTVQNKFYLLEINPRLPAWIGVSSGAGQNFAEILVRLALGEKVRSRSKYKIGTVFIRHAEDLIVDIYKIGELITKGELRNLSI